MDNSSVRKYDPLLLPVQWYLVLLVLRGVFYGFFVAINLGVISIALSLIFDAFLALVAITLLASIVLTSVLVAWTIRRDRVARTSHIAKRTEPNELLQNGLWAVWNVWGDDWPNLKQGWSRSDRALYQFVRYGKASWQRKVAELVARIVSYVAVIAIIVGFIIPTPLPWNLGVLALIVLAIFNLPLTARMFIGGLKLRQICKFGELTNHRM